jgi:DNA invertase Pin-like site-specific DNA recombinase
MKTCFGYIRVSTQKQGEGVSLEAQKDAITAFASRHDLRISEWFEEKETAAKSGRPVFTRMLRLLDQGKATGLIIHKIDRSARNLKDWAIISELSDKGIGVYFATESLDFRSRGGRLTADIQAVIAADYIRNLREETKKGIDGRLKQGLYPFRAPLGYRDNGRGQPKTPCPVTSPLIKHLFALYASGQHSFRSLHREAERIGLRNLAGGKLSLHGVEAILNNPFYCGLIVIRRAGARYDGIHEPLIDVPTFRLVQDIKAGKAGKKVTRHNHLFRGLFRCGLCSGPLSPERQKGRVYYRCQTSSCPTKTVREDQLDQTVADRLGELALGPEEIAETRRQLLDWLRGHDQDEWRRSLQLRFDRATQRLDRLTDLLIDGTVIKADFERRRASLVLEIAELREEERKASTNQLTDTDIENFLELATSLHLQYKIASDGEKRMMVQNCFSNCTLTPGKLNLEPQNWLHDLKNGLSAPNGDPGRHTSRTSSLPKILSAISRILDAGWRKKDPEPLPIQEPGVPQWKYSLKNQSIKI